MGYTNLKAVAISLENYEKLKGLGRAGDSMNSVVTKLFVNQIVLLS
jgi:predicted CopG family antitoxin